MPTAFTERLSRLAHEPSLFLHQIDAPGLRALIVELPEAQLRHASFVDERILVGGKREGGWLALDVALAAADALRGRAPDAIFHIGHCGSTLLSRALDHLPGVLGLREPLALRCLAERLQAQPHAGADWSPEIWDSRFDRTLALLDRRFPSTTRVLAKATSNCNALIAPWLRRHAHTRALLLHIPLRSYLATLLKSEDAVRDALHFAPARAQALAALLGDASALDQPSTLGAALALGWLAECARFHQLASDASIAPRLLRVDFEHWLAEPAAVLSQIAAHFGFAQDPDAIAAALAAEGGRYAKATEHPYSAADRAADLAQSQRRFGAEIANGLALADRLAALHPRLANVV